MRLVQNLLAVTPPKVAADKVRSAIAEALERHAAHAAKHVEVSIEEDRVKLTGKVPSWSEREAIIGAVRGTRGVQKVESHLLIHA